jgi:hypothetical protein
LGGGAAQDAAASRSVSGAEEALGAASKLLRHDMALD